MKVKQQIMKVLEEDGGCHLTLIDPEEQSPAKAAEMVKEAEKGGTDGIMIGGSGVDLEATNKVSKAIKESTELPVIIFPGNTTSITPHADAIFFMSLLNSRSRYWLSMSQAFASFSVKKAGLEPISLGYILLESSNKTSVEFYGDANVIPREKPEITAAFALAAQYMGMSLVYLEAGSGAAEPVPNETIKLVKNVINVPLIVGGGIRNGETAAEKIKSGADIIVTGTIAEETNQLEDKIREIVTAVKNTK